MNVISQNRVQLAGTIREAAVERTFANRRFFSGTMVHVPELGKRTPMEIGLDIWYERLFDQIASLMPGEEVMISGSLAPTGEPVTKRGASRSACASTRSCCSEPGWR